MSFTRWGYTPLLSSVRSGFYYTTKMLLLKGSDTTQRNCAGMDAMQIAEARNHGCIAHLLSKQWPEIVEENKKPE
jgi:hypothetical protein